MYLCEIAFTGMLQVLECLTVTPLLSDFILFFHFQARPLLCYVFCQIEFMDVLSYLMAAESCKGFLRRNVCQKCINRAIFLLADLWLVPNSVSFIITAIYSCKGSKKQTFTGNAENLWSLD